MIPQIEPWIDEEDLREVGKVIRSTFVTEHEATKEFERRLGELTGAKHVIAMANGTVAIFAALRALGIGKGDEVIVPDMTFVATANAVILTGATPIFCDVRSDTFCIDVKKAEALITNQTRAIMPVHLYGLAAEMDELSDLCHRRGLLLIEDAAQGVGVNYRGRHVGTFGDAGILSFYGNKTITTGEGGAILTDNDQLAVECYKLKNHGRKEKGIFVHESIGFNFSFTDLQAALGIAQLNKLDRIVSRKKQIRDQYSQSLGDIPDIEFQSIPDHTTPVFWFTNIRLDKVDDLVDSLKTQGIGSRRFFYPLHRQPCYQNFNQPGCPISFQAYEQGLSLPSGVCLTDKQIDSVIYAVREFYGFDGRQ